MPCPNRKDTRIQETKIGSRNGPTYDSLCSGEILWSLSWTSGFSMLRCFILKWGLSFRGQSKEPINLRLFPGTLDSLCPATVTWERSQHHTRGNWPWSAGWDKVAPTWGRREHVWNSGDTLGCLSVFPCPNVTVKGHAQQSWPEKAMITKGSKPSDMCIWITLSGCERKPPLSHTLLSSTTIPYISGHQMDRSSSHTKQFSEINWVSYNSILTLCSWWKVTKLCATLATPWTVACKAALSMGLSRQEYWSGLPFPSPGDLPDPGIKPRSPVLQADSLPTELHGETPILLETVSTSIG